MHGKTPRRRLKSPRRGRIAAAPDVRAALDALRRIVQALRVARRGRERGAGLSSAQIFALQQLAEHPSASVNDLAALTFTHQSSVSVVIQRLAELGLVAKVAASDDRRRKRLALTRKGRAVLHRTPVAAQERLIAALSALPARDRRTVARSLGDVVHVMVPDGGTSHPPMFFEEHAARGGRKGPRGAHGRRKGRLHSEDGP